MSDGHPRGEWDRYVESPSCRARCGCTEVRVRLFLGRVWGSSGDSKNREPATLSDLFSLCRKQAGGRVLLSAVRVALWPGNRLLTVLQCLWASAGCRFRLC